MKIGVTPDCYEKIEAKIQAIENLAIEGEFTMSGSVTKFQRIIAELGTLRRILLENFIAIPDQPDGPRAA